MSEVPAILFHFFRRAVERLEVDPLPCMEGLELPQGRPDLEDRTRWDDLAQFLQRATEGLDDATLDRLGALHLQENEYLQMLLQLPLSPRVYYCLVADATRPYFPHLRVDFEELDGCRWRLALELPDGYIGCRPLFYATGAQLRAAGEVLSGEGTTTVQVDAGSHHGRYEIYAPPPSRPQETLDAAARQAEALARELVRMADWAMSRGAAWKDPQMLQKVYGLTRAEARVVVRLADGKAPEEIAGELGIGVATVRSHLKAAYSKTGTTRQVELVRLVLGSG